MKNIFDKAVANELISRIDKLMANTSPQWGKMNVSQMLAHCNVSFELTYENKHTKPTGIKKFLLKLFVKKFVVGPKPYSKNTRTAPEFIIVDKREFEVEKQRLINYILQTQKLGKNYFDGRDYHSFGILSGDEWNNLFYKHIDHHLSQFGV
jgi:hypothetical protein